MRFGFFRKSRKTSKPAIVAAARDASRSLIEQLEQRQLLTVSGGLGMMSGTEHSYDGSTTVSSGTITIGGLNTSTGVTGSASDTLLLNGGSAGNSFITANNSVNVGLSGLATLQFGSGSFILSGTNTYSGTTTVSIGTLTLTAASNTGTVAGQITDDKGNPLSDARVHLVPISTPGITILPSFHLFAITDSSGDYTIDGVPAGSYVVKARDHGYVPNASASFTVAAGNDAAPTVKLTAVVTGTVTGQVTDDKGNPLSDAHVRLTPASLSSPTPGDAMATEFIDSGRFGLFATTDANGDYVINNVVAGSYSVTAHDKGFTANTSADFTVAGGSNTAPTVQLTPIVFGTVAGQVTDDKGNPLADAHVLLALDSSSSVTPDLGDLFGGHRHGRYRATTDANGDYVINNVPAGSYTVKAHDQGFTPNTSASFTVGAGSNTAPTIKLTAIVFGTVTGQVTDDKGNPLAGAWVVLSSPVTATPAAGGLSNVEGDFGFFAQTDSNGDYTIDDVVAGSYTVTAHDQGFTPATSATFTVGAGSNTAPTLKLSPIVSGTVTGEVTDSKGTPLSDAHVYLLSNLILHPGGPQPLVATNDLMFLPPFGLFATTDSSGDYTINNVPAGTYKVVAFDHGYQSNSSADFTVGGGTNTAPTVALTASTSPTPLPIPWPIFGGEGAVLD